MIIKKNKLSLSSMPLINNSKKKFFDFHYQSRTRSSQEIKSNTLWLPAIKCLTSCALKMIELKGPLEFHKRFC